jgi:hypothetical protein
VISQDDFARILGVKLGREGSRAHKIVEHHRQVAALGGVLPHHARGRIEDVRELLEPALVGFSVGPELPEVAEAERLVGEVRSQPVKDNLRSERQCPG